MILGDLPPMEGTAEIGQSVTVARFEQHQADELDPERDRARHGPRRHRRRVPAGKSLRTYLASFGFRDDAVERKIGVLSGGERTRLALAKVMAGPGRTADPRRADQPPRPGQLRHARGRAQRLSRHGPAGHPRPLPDPFGGRRADRGPRRHGHDAPRRPRSRCSRPGPPTTRRDTAGKERPERPTRRSQPRPRSRPEVRDVEQPPPKGGRHGRRSQRATRSRPATCASRCSGSSGSGSRPRPTVAEIQAELGRPRALRRSERLRERQPAVRRRQGPGGDR